MSTQHENRWRSPPVAALRSSTPAAGLTPLISSRLPLPDCKRPSAASMRDCPPVKTMMASAPRGSTGGFSSVTWVAKSAKPAKNSPAPGSTPRRTALIPAAVPGPRRPAASPAADPAGASADSGPFMAGLIHPNCGILLMESKGAPTGPFPPSARVMVPDLDVGQPGHDGEMRGRRGQRPDHQDDQRHACVAAGADRKIPEEGGRLVGLGRGEV